MESKEINSERIWNIPPYASPPTHTQGWEVHPHSIIHINCNKRKDKKPGVFKINASIFNPLNMFAHTLAHPLLIHKTQAARFVERNLYTPPEKMCSQKWLLQPKEREAASYQFDCHSGLWQIPSLPLSSLSLSLSFGLFFFPKQSKSIRNISPWTLATNTTNPKTKKFQGLNNTPAKTTGQRNEKLPDDWKLGTPTQELTMSSLASPPDVMAQNRNTV